MRAGASESDAYLAEWRTSDPVEREGEPEDVAARLVDELEKAYPPERLEKLVQNSGRE
jgi:Virulence factor